VKIEKIGTSQPLNRDELKVTNEILSSYWDCFLKSTKRNCSFCCWNPQRNWTRTKHQMEYFIQIFVVKKIFSFITFQVI
jgi:hypothetical protein